MKCAHIIDFKGFINEGKLWLPWILLYNEINVRSSPIILVLMGPHLLIILKGKIINAS